MIAKNHEVQQRMKGQKKFCENRSKDLRIEMQDSKHVAQRTPKSILSLLRRKEG